MSINNRRLGDRRGRTRFEIVGHLWGSLETVEPLAVVNLGPGGALVRSRTAVNPDAVLRLRFSYRDVVSEFDARVRHVRPLGPEAEAYLVGFEFLTVPPVVAEQIGALVASSTSPHASVKA